MAKKPYAALGTVKTPHGDVIVRKVFEPTKGSFFFEYNGPHLAIRWMLPAWKPKNPATKTQFTPPRTISTVEDAQAVYFKMAAAWEHKLSSEGFNHHAFEQSALHPYTTLGQLRVIVEAEITATLRPSTVITYKHQWNGAFAYIPAETPVLNVDRIMIQDAVTRMSATNLSPATVHHNIGALNRLFIRAVEDGVLTSNPIKKVKLPKLPRRIPRYLTALQREDLLQVAKANGRDAYLLIVLGVYLGLRKAELISMRWDQIDLNQRVAQVMNQEHFTTKSGKNRTVPISDDLFDILLPFSNSIGFILKPENQYETGKRYRWDFKGLFESMVRTARLQKWVTPHVMRHTFASLYAQAGVSLYKIGQWMGHSSQEMTEIYAHLAAYDPDINKGGSSDSGLGFKLQK